MRGFRIMRLPLLATAVLAVSSLASCHSGGGNSVDAMDKALVNEATPASGALAGAIQVDPSRTHGGYLRQVEDSAMPGLGCLAGLVYSNEWAGKLPADLPLYPQARLTEAAGHEGSCKARVASFVAKGERPAVLGWYADRAKAAGYDTMRADKGGDWILAGQRGDAFAYIIVGPTGHGETPVDYIWTQG